MINRALLFLGAQLKVMLYRDKAGLDVAAEVPAPDNADRAEEIAWGQLTNMPGVVGFVIRMDDGRVVGRGGEWEPASN